MCFIHTKGNPLALIMKYIQLNQKMFLQFFKEKNRNKKIEEEVKYYIQLQRAICDVFFDSILVGKSESD